MEFVGWFVIAMTLGLIDTVLLNEGTVVAELWLQIIGWFYAAITLCGLSLFVVFVVVHNPNGTWGIFLGAMTGGVLGTLFLNFFRLKKEDRDLFNIIS